MSDSFATPWTIARQASLSMGFSRQEYWSGLPFPPLGDLSDPGIELESSALAGGFFTTEPLGKPICPYTTYINAPKGDEKKESIVTRQNFTKSAMEGLSELSFHWGLEAK